MFRKLGFYEKLNFFVGDALKDFAKDIENNYFTELLLVATSEPRMILILYLKPGLFEPRR